MNKYRNKPVWHDGIRFASGAEGDRYLELKLLLRAGKIRELIVHPRYKLHAHPKGLAVGTYVADFEYKTDVGKTIEDVKGMLTPEYKWKKRHMRAEYGIEIREIKRGGK